MNFIFLCFFQQKGEGRKAEQKKQIAVFDAPQKKGKNANNKIICSKITFENKIGNPKNTEKKTNIKFLFRFFQKIKKS